MASNRPLRRQAAAEAFVDSLCTTPALPTKAEIESALVSSQIPWTPTEIENLKGAADLADSLFSSLFKPVKRTLPVFLFFLAAVGLSRAEQLPDAPHPVIRAVVVSPAAETGFFANKTNRALVAGDFLTRTLDAASTEAFIHNPCHCMVESGEPTFVADHAALQYAVSLTEAGAITYAADRLWKHRHPRLARLVLATDITVDGLVGPVNNWTRIADSTTSHRVLAPGKVAF